MTVSVKTPTEDGDGRKSAAGQTDIPHQYHFFSGRKAVDMALLCQRYQIRFRTDLDPLCFFLCRFVCRYGGISFRFVIYRTICCGEHICIYRCCISK